MSDRENVVVIHRANDPPIRISKARWPVVYTAYEHDSHGHWTQATNAWWLTVRRHADGRAAVIGRRDSEIKGHGVRAAKYCGRYSRDGSTILRAVESVLRDIGAPHGLTACVMREVRERLRAGNP